MSAKMQSVDPSQSGAWVLRTIFSSRHDIAEIPRDRQSQWLRAGSGGRGVLDQMEREHLWKKGAANDISLLPRRR
jgi:hypothetical protein